MGASTCSMATANSASLRLYCFSIMPPCHHAAMPPLVHALTFAGIFAACADRAPVHVRAFHQTGVPLSWLEVSAIPFDPGRILDSLTRFASAPPPDFRALE